MAEEGKAPLPQEAGDQDTRTRKTVRLRSSVAAPDTVKIDTPISDPLAGRNTDTGNLEVMADTQTRRTLKLKPLAPPGSNPGARLNLSPDGNTTTRKTVMLRPLNGGAPEAETKAAAAPAAAEPAEDHTAAVPRPAAGPRPLSSIHPAPLPARPAPQGVAATRPPTVFLSGKTEAPAQEAPTMKIPADESDHTAAVPRPGVLPKASAASEPSSKPTVLLGQEQLKKPEPYQPSSSAKTLILESSEALRRPSPSSEKTQVLEAPLEAADHTAAVPRPAPAPGKTAILESSAEISDHTAAVPRPAVETTESEEDHTVKMQRPPRLSMPPKPAPVASRSTVKLPSDGAVPKAVLPPASSAAPEDDDAKATVKLPPPKLSVPGKGAMVNETVALKAPAVPQPAKPQKKAVVPPPAPTAAAPVAAVPVPPPVAALAPEKEVSAEQAKEAKEAANSSAEAKNEKKPIETGYVMEEESSPSILYLALAVLTLVCVIATSAMTAAHYFDFVHQVKIYSYIPGLPHAK